MPRFTKEGQTPIETAIPREAASLRAQGWSEQKARTREVKQADAAKTDPAETPKS
jgi:hypothetical protein